MGPLSLLLLLLGRHVLLGGGLEGNHLLGGEGQAGNEGNQVILEKLVDKVGRRQILGGKVEANGDLGRLDEQDIEGHVANEDEEPNDVSGLAGRGGGGLESRDKTEDVIDGAHGHKEELDQVKEPSWLNDLSIIECRLNSPVISHVNGEAHQSDSDAQEHAKEAQWGNWDWTRIRHGGRFYR